jgi:hypothetical protein
MHEHGMAWLAAVLLVAATAGCKSGSTSTASTTSGSSGSGTSDGAGATSGGTTGDGTASGQGMIGGQQFSPVDAISRAEYGKGFGFFGTPMFVELSGYANLCGAWANNADVAGGQTLVLGFAWIDSSGTAQTPTAPGVYTVDYLGAPPAKNSATAKAFYQLSCSSTAPYDASSGSVTVTRIDSTSVEGSYDITMNCSDFNCPSPELAHLTGTFHSVGCSALDINKSLACADGG